MALTKVKGHIIADDLALGGNPTTSTQSASDNSTKIATTAYVTTAVSNLVDGAPSTLNTLNEIAAALNDDAALNTTLTNSIATKLPLAGGTMTGSLIIAKDDNTFTVQSTNAGQASVDIKNTEGHFRLITDAGALKVYDQTDSSERFKIDTSGNVGIGVTSVGEKLHVKGTGRFENSHSTPVSVHINSGNNDYGQIFASTASAWKNLVLNQYGGNVGIGTTTPNKKLEIFGSGSESGILIKNDTNTNYRGIYLGALEADNAAYGKFHMSAQTGELNITAGASGYGGLLTIDTNGAERMRIDSNGKVRIGATLGLNHLLNIQTASTSGLAQMEFRNTAAGTQIGMPANTNALSFFTADGERMRIDSSGNVGIGTIAPTQKLDVAGTALLENAKLKAIAESNTDTAVDIFIYDTSKDSDGGAWRKRTRNTSWYNETLNTSTRGARKEFPSVAVIVALGTSGNNVTIYDGDDPDLPMWMKFTLLNQDNVSISAMNGVVCLGNRWVANSGYGGNGIVVFEFVADRSRHGLDNATVPSYNPERVGVISGNQADTSIWPKTAGNAARFYDIVNTSVTDVSMTVLPNAPVDIETGLPKPTIAVATNGGVSIIKDTGDVVDITASAGSAYSGVTWVDITKNDNLIFEQDNSSNPRSIFCIPIPSADRTSATSDGIINDKVVMKFYRGGTHKPYPCFNGAGVNEAVALEGDNQLLRSNTSAGGDLTILEPNLASPALGKVAYIGHDYNSGWLVGDTKVATLSDTSTTSATSPDLVTNGSNFSNTTGWTGQSATVSVSSSELLVTGTASINSNQSATWTTISCTKGDQFQVTFRISAFVANQSSAGIIVGGATIHKNNDLGYWYPNTAATHTTTVTATGPNFTLYLHAGISVGVVTRFDDISIHKLQHDRTQYKHGFQTFGTLAKSVVATGAELVGYGPFSASNYLQQSYTSELDFNSGDFAYCFWVYNDFATTSYVADRAEGNGNYRTALYMTATNSGTMYFYTRDGGAYTEAAAIIGTPNQWTQIWCIRRGTSHEIWVNGVQKVTAVDTNGSSSSGTTGTVRDVSNASGDAVQRIGVRFSGSTPNTGKMALFRISGTAPSEEQIVKIYNDERKLFEINSDATMGGSSSAATVLAYDDVRKEMHVGSSWGRSVFQGLSRVEFDSDVPTTSLSVNDGFVVEE